MVALLFYEQGTVLRGFISSLNRAATVKNKQTNLGQFLFKGRKIWTFLTSPSGMMFKNKTKSILKQKSEDDEFFSKHNRRVRLFLESEQTLL